MEPHRLRALVLLIDIIFRRMKRSCIDAIPGFNGCKFGYIHVMRNCTETLYLFLKVFLSNG